MPGWVGPDGTIVRPNKGNEMIGKTLDAFASAPNFRGKARVFRLLSGCLRYRSVQSHYGPRLARMAGDSAHAYCATGAYGEFVAKAVRDLDHESQFIDIGSNQGLFALVAAGQPLYKRIIAFEPNPELFAILIQNIQLNGATNVVPMCAGLGPERGISLLKVVPGNSGLSTLTDAPNTDAGSTSKAVLILRPCEIGPLIDPDLPITCKIDVEGFESEVISGLRDADWFNRVTRIITEVSLAVGSEDNRDSIFAQLEDAGFTLQDRSGFTRHYDALFVR